MADKSFWREVWAAFCRGIGPTAFWFWLVVVMLTAWILAEVVHG